MTTEQLFKDYWPHIASTIALIVWAVRVEGRQRATDKRVDLVQDMHKTESGRLVTAIERMAATQEAMGEKINEMRTTLAGVVGYEKGAQEARKGRAR